MPGFPQGSKPPGYFSGIFPPVSMTPELVDLGIPAPTYQWRADFYDAAGLTDDDNVGGPSPNLEWDDRIASNSAQSNGGTSFEPHWHESGGSSPIAENTIRFNAANFEAFGDLDTETFLDTAKLTACYIGHITDGGTIFGDDDATVSTAEMYQINDTSGTPIIGNTSGNIHLNGTATGIVPPGFGCWVFGRGSPTTTDDNKWMAFANNRQTANDQGEYGVLNAVERLGRARAVSASWPHALHNALEFIFWDNQVLTVAQMQLIYTGYAKPRYADLADI